MNEELQIFSEDMDEQLSIMENTLLDMFEIPLESVDEEMINKLFRAMHTLKGNSGMFGFDDVVAFAHLAENLLGEIRNNSIELTQEMLDLFLLVNDHSRTLLDVTLKDEQFDEDQLEYHNELIIQLSTFLGIEEPTLLEVETKSEEFEEDAAPKYMIKITPKDSFFKSDMDLVSIIKFLDVIGDVEDFQINTENLPSFEELIPLESYISFSFLFKSEESLGEIKEAFEYVINDIELLIESLNQEELETPKETEQQSTQSNKKSIGSSLRVDASKVDQLVDLISEMVIANSKITKIAEEEKNIELFEASDTLITMLEEMRTSVMGIRMMQVGSSLHKLRRIVNDTAKKMDKEIEFVISGEETELDKTVIEKISDPLVHMLRNSIDHGIETKERRIEKGKPATGRIDLRAYTDAGNVVIEIEDDGAGISKEAILNKAIENGLVASDDTLSDKEIYNLIFAAGLSTAKEKRACS